MVKPYSSAAGPAACVTAYARIDIPRERLDHVPRRRGAAGSGLNPDPRRCPRPAGGSPPGAIAGPES